MPEYLMILPSMWQHFSPDAVSNFMPQPVELSEQTKYPPPHSSLDLQPPCFSPHGFDVVQHSSSYPVHSSFSGSHLSIPKVDMFRYCNCLFTESSNICIFAKKPELYQSATLIADIWKYRAFIPFCTSLLENVVFKN